MVKVEETIGFQVHQSNRRFQANDQMQSVRLERRPVFPKYGPSVEPVEEDVRRAISLPELPEVFPALRNEAGDPDLQAQAAAVRFLAPD